MVYIFIKNDFFKKPNNGNMNIELLKNALLSLALKEVCRDKIDNFNMNYESYDGTKLPMFSGFSLENACFTYIQDEETSKRNPFNSIVMESKSKAIDAFLNNQLNSEKSVFEFFKSFVMLYENGPVNNENALSENIDISEKTEENVGEDLDKIDEDICEDDEDKDKNV